MCRQETLNLPAECNAADQAALVCPRDGHLDEKRPLLTSVAEARGRAWIVPLSERSVQQKLSGVAC
jgi:hypothetical protein